MKKHLFFGLFFILVSAVLSGCGAVSGIFPEKKEVVVLTTDLGEMHMILYDFTPKHRDNFLKLAKSGYYDGTTFHRVIGGFMIQGGDPNTKDGNPENDGLGGPDYSIPAEIRPELKHKYGAVAAARKGDNINPNKESNGSQFYIVEEKKGTPFLDNKYTVFGQVIKGLEVVDKIASQAKDKRDRPLKDIKMKVSVKKMTKKKIQSTYGYTMP